MVQSKACSPTCPSFKCGKNSAFFRRDNVWCRVTEEICNIGNCTYAMCTKRRLLPHGICGETVKRKTVERSLEGDDFDNSIKLKGKTLRKLGDREIY